MRRSFFAPEVVQTSEMDCGPAALTCLLSGHGIPAHYGRLREACQTDVDGTSIDVLEDVGNRLGLEVEQTLSPLDHLLVPGARTLPAIVVVRAGNGLTHFVVAWRLHGSWIQVMDPAVGRRFLPVREFLQQVYVHTLVLPGDQVAEWTEQGTFRAVQQARLKGLGVDPTPFLEPEGVPGAASLDAALRAVTDLVEAGAVRRGGEAERVLASLREQARGDAGVLPASQWAIEPLPDGEARVRGAICLKVVGPRPEGPSPDLSPDLRAAVTTARASPWRDLWRISGLRPPWLLGAAVGIAAASALVEALLFRGALDLGRELGPFRQRLAAAVLLLAWLILVTSLEVPIRAATRRLGRLVEARVRAAFQAKVPRLGDRYLASRPVSDMAQRAHALHRLRSLVELVADGARTGAALLATAVGLVWLDPPGAPLVLVGAAACVGIPLACLPALEERDLRLRVHGGALFRFYLDALLGLVPIRAHAAERSVRREHESLLVDWALTGRALLRTAVMVEALQGALPLAVAAVLVGSHASRAADGGGMLLFAWWALQLPFLGQELGRRLRQLPHLRNVTLRLLEPLGALEEVPNPGVAQAPLRPSNAHGVALRLEEVDVVAGGHPVLSAVSLEVPAGGHLAVVGPSGAGKSSLVGLLLGWHRPAAGRVLVDGAPLDEAGLEALRAATAWVDPGVQLWNRGLLDNLTYGAGDSSPAPLDLTLRDAELEGVLVRLPQGLGTPIGEGGGALSGGEGQRVRLGRALHRPAPRLVVLDEPFRGLDRDRRRALLARVRARWSEATVLCITHDIEETRDMPRVLVIEGGRLVEDGDPTALAADPAGRYRALLDEEAALRAEVWEDPRWRHHEVAAAEVPA